MKVTSPWFYSGSLHEVKCLGPFPRVGYLSEELIISLIILYSAFTFGLSRTKPCR